MKKEFHIGNRKALYKSLKPGSLVAVFSGHSKLKTADENYAFFAERNFVYLTGIESEGYILLAEIEEERVKETLFILPPDAHAERWTGRRLKPDEAAEISGVENIAYLSTFDREFHKAASCGKFKFIGLDLGKLNPAEEDHESYVFAKKISSQYPQLDIENIRPQLRKQRTIKQPCEIEAMRKAELINKEAIIAMMKASKPGMYEYQYKAEYDYVLSQHGVLSPAFPSIISAGDNNFCIHYYAYTGQAKDGDMVLNDVGAKWDNIGTDVSRGWPVNGKYNEKQRLLYTCAYNTSNYMFSIIKPGMPMKDVDATARKYVFEQLKKIGLCEKYEDIGKYVWHGGAHHVGYDTHDIVDASGAIEPGMIFCVDIGIYCEEWGIGFRLEDNCLVTEDGCENLSACVPRSIEDIEKIMAE